MRDKLQNHLGALMLSNIEQQAALENGNAVLEKTYQMLAEIVRSDQLTHEQVADIIKSDKGFSDWYTGSIRSQSGEG